MRKLVKRLLRRSTQFTVGAKLYEAQYHLRMLRTAYTGGFHEPDFQYFRLFAGKNAVFADIGANIGQSIISFKTGAPDCSVRSFEPNPISFRFAERVSKRFSKVHVFPIALGRASGKLTLHIPCYRSLVFSQLASTQMHDKEKLCAWLRQEGFTFLRPESIAVETIEVEVKPLDSLGLLLDGIKIDTEGEELSALEGAWETIKKSRPVLLIEGGRRPEICEALATLGYKTYSYNAATGLLKSGVGALNTFFLC